MEENDEASRVRALGEVLKEFDLDSIRVKIGEAEYELIRREPQSAPAAMYAMPPPALAGAPAAGAAPPEGGAAGAAPAGAPPNAKVVTAPVVGVFYRASSPGADPYVNVGDRVTAGQTLCILEAMKLMNEITSDYAGVVTRVLPENGNLVTLGEELIWIEP